MTEFEWNESIEPQEMLRFIATIPDRSERKRRLFVVACFRHVWHLLPDERSRAAIEALEAAEGEDCWDDQIGAAASDAGEYGSGDGANRVVARALVDCLRDCKKPSRDYPIMPPAEFRRRQEHAHYPAAAAKALVKAVGLSVDLMSWSAMGDERRTQADFVRDIFGPLPFRQVHIDLHVRNNASVQALAESAYTERHLPDGTLDNQNLLVLADALEESGCRDAEILAHCRSARPHVRGCWVIDCLLARP
jgi:hypothetical protein